MLAFLDRYECHEGHTELRRDFLRKFIEKQNDRGDCRIWTVGVVSLKDASKPKARLGLLDVEPVNRSKLQDRGDGVDLGTITTQENFRLGLSREQRQPATSDSKRKQPKRPAGSESLLLLVPIDKESMPKRSEQTSIPKGQENRQMRQRETFGAAEHILGLALAFPDSKTRSFGENYIQLQLPDQPVYVESEELFVEDDDG